MNPKNIYIDCDEVLLDTAKTIADYLREQFNLIVDKNKYPSEWDLSQSPLGGYQATVANFVRTDRFAHIPLMPEAKEGIEALKSQGYQISIVTSISEDGAAHKKREMNIHDLFGSTIFERITCLPMEIDNKGKYYSSVPHGIVVDDGIYNLLTAQKYGHEVILMATDQNPQMQQTARERNIPIHTSLISVARYLSERQR
ncbi:MAG: HAD family hydrolase [Alphaproteobacteria bacterium]|nr:HAD family hydrolase [Alphaproteobacteria bacterium]